MARRRSDKTPPRSSNTSPKPRRVKPIRPRVPRPPGMGGRMRELTPEVQKTIVGLLTRGEYIETVCGIIGIARKTFYEWRTRGESAMNLLADGKHVDPGEQMFIDFTLAVDKALGISEAWDNNIIRTAAEGGKPTKTVTRRRYAALDRGVPLLNEQGEPIYVEEETVVEGSTQSQWQASAWRLERKYPDRYGRRVQTELTGKGGGPIKTEEVKPDLSKLSVEELEQLDTLLERVESA